MQNEKYSQDLQDIASSNQTPESPEEVDSPSPNTFKKRAQSLPKETVHLAKVVNPKLLQPSAMVRLQQRKHSLQQAEKMAPLQLIRPKYMAQHQLESILDEELLVNKHQFSSKTPGFGNSRSNFYTRTGQKKRSALPFKVELICSKKVGLIGQLPTGMNHRFKQKLAENASVAKVSQTQLMSKTASTRNMS